jgi:hypothetical protein
MARGLGSRGFLIGLTLLLPFMALGSPAARADDEPKPKEEPKKEETRPVIDKTKVYFGCASTCKAPAVVDSDKVYRSIPEYKKILDQKLTDKDAEYSILLLKATRKFRTAIEEAAKDGSNDLVAAVGSVKWDGHTVPDLTDAAVKKVEEASRGNP